MSNEIRVPALGESITEATIAQWYKKPGDAVSVDEPLCELETDKVTIEVPAHVAGVLSEIIAKEGETVEVGALLASIGEGQGAVAPAVEATPEPAPAPEAASAPEPAPVATPVEAAEASASLSAATQDLSPAARRVVEEHGLAPQMIAGTGKDGRITKEDAMQAAQSGTATPSSAKAASASAAAPAASPAVAATGLEERVKMTRLRKTIASRLKESQNTAAQLTTFNEVDMSALMALRSEYKDLFEKKYGVRLGFMAFSFAPV